MALAGVLAFGFALASGAQGLDCSPLAGLRAGREATRALAGRIWHKPDCPEGPSSFGLDLGGGKKRTAVKGREAAERSAVYPLRRRLFCETGRGQRWEGATKGAGPDQGLSWEAEHRPSADGGGAWGGGETGGLGEAGRRAGRLAGLRSRPAGMGG